MLCALTLGARKLLEIDRFWICRNADRGGVAGRIVGETTPALTASQGTVKACASPGYQSCTGFIHKGGEFPGVLAASYRFCQDDLTSKTPRAEEANGFIHRSGELFEAMEGDMNPFIWVAYDVPFHDHHLTSGNAVEIEFKEIQRPEH